MIRASVDQDGDFKNCCMPDGKFDGSQRHYFFQRVAKRAARWPPLLLLSHFRLDIELNIQVLHIQRILFDEFAAGFDVFSHQCRKNGLGFGNIFELDGEQRTPFRIHRRIP